MIPFTHPFSAIMSSPLGRDISQLLGQDVPGPSIPAVNILETPDHYVISIRVPGFSKDELTISCEKDVLTVTGKKARNTNATQERFLRREFTSDDISRSFRLPATVRTADITAEQHDGILHVKVPKAQVQRPPVRTINIA